ncbi:prepilin peptidase [Nocardia sp. NPDC088792]|uniref:prepilin peptidase n=1 Tax=Nocardia sp. NPDC088792 TaxID=3364332 RepID=UPI003829D1AF
MNLPAILLLTVWGAVLSGFDLRWQRLPNALTLPGAGAILIYAAATDRFTTAAAGGLLLATPYLLVHVCAPDALGAGDVKLALGLGAATAMSGPQTWVWAALAAPLLTAIAGIGRMLAESRPSPLVLASGTRPDRRVDSRWQRLLCAIASPASRAGSRSGRMLFSGARERHSAVRVHRSSVGGGRLAHGPAMCVASVVALLAAR